MWKLKVEFESQDHAIDFINKLRNIKLVEYTIETNSQIVISSRNIYTKELVLQLLSETIITIYKTQFFNNNIKLYYLPKQQKEQLIKHLTNLDIECDVYYILNAIENFTTFILKSINHFLLTKSKNRWKEYAYITNINGYYY